MRVFEGVDVGKTKGNGAKRGGNGRRMLGDRCCEDIWMAPTDKETTGGVKKQTR